MRSALSFILVRGYCCYCPRIQNWYHCLWYFANQRKCWEMNNTLPFYLSWKKMGHKCMLKIQLWKESSCSSNSVLAVVMFIDDSEQKGRPNACACITHIRDGLTSIVTSGERGKHKKKRKGEPWTLFCLAPPYHRTLRSVTGIIIYSVSAGVRWTVKVHDPVHSHTCIIFPISFG